MCKIICFNRKTYPSSSSIIIKSCHRTGCLAYSRGCSTVWANITDSQHQSWEHRGKPPASMWLVLLLRHLWDQPWCAQLTDDAALFKKVQWFRQQRATQVRHFSTEQPTRLTNTVPKSQVCFSSNMKVYISVSPQTGFIWVCCQVFKLQPKKLRESFKIFLFWKLARH